MRRFTPIAFAILTVTGIAGRAGASAPATTDPATTDPVSTEPTGTAAAEIAPADTVVVPAAEPVVVVDENGTPTAQITIGEVTPDWVDYGEYDEPATGAQYVQVAIVVESLSPRGVFSVDGSDFVLQDADGFLFGSDILVGDVVAGSDPLESWDLANGESAEFVVTFEVVSGVAPDTLYYYPDSSRLVTLTTLS